MLDLIGEIDVERVVGEKEEQRGNQHQPRGKTDEQVVEAADGEPSASGQVVHDQPGGDDQQDRFAWSQQGNQGAASDSGGDREHERQDAATNRRTPDGQRQEDGADRGHGQERGHQSSSSRNWASAP